MSTSSKPEPHRLVDDGRDQEEQRHVARELVPALVGVVEGLAEHEAEEVLARPAGRSTAAAATSVLNSVTLICTHIASPVMRVSVPKVMLTAPAMNGMIGGRPSTHSVTTSDRIVETISAHVPAAMP